MIHRDLKPSNVLVTLHDGVPVPKVIDFGVAKAINQRLSEHTIYTRMAQIVGTPMYMSPEQAELSALDVDTRSDVYSLGVLLYELLTGSTPFTKETLHQAGFDEMRRIIREVEPPRPSQRISTLDARARTTRSAKRGLDERQLKRHLEGELDWIVMKALEKDRQRRYESASSFAADIQRYLDDQPVEACPPSTFYRLRKLVRRNRANLTVAVVMSTTLVGGTGISLLVHNANLSKYNTELMRLNGDLKQATANAQSQQSKAEDNERRKGDALYAADVNRAARALGDNDALAAKLLLNRQVPDGGDSDRRGFEWWYLRGRIEHANRILLDVGSALYVLCPTPDGRLLAAAGQDATVRLFDPETGTIEREIATGQIEVNGVAFSPDGREMATAGDDGTIRIWRLETGTERIEFRAHPGKAFQLVYSHDGGSIISCGDDPIIRIFASDSGRRTEELRGHTKTVQTLLLASPEMLISGSDDETARRWFLDHSNEPFQIASDTKVSALSAAPGRNLLFTGNERNVVEACSLRDGRKISQVKHLDSIRSLALHPAGELLAVGDRDGSIRLWKVGADAEIDSENVRVWQAHQGSTHGLSWAADGSRLVSVGDDGRAMSWSLSEMQSESPRRFKVDRSSSFCLIPGTTSLVTCGSKECALVRWNWHTGNEEGRFAAPILAYRPVRISPDGTQMAATCISHQLLHAQPVEWWFRAPIPGQQWGEWGYGGYVGAPRFSPDSRWIAVAFQADGASQKHVWLLGLPDFARSEQIPIPVAGAGEAAFSPDGRFLAIARITGLVLWDIAGSKALWESAEPHTGVVEFSPDGKYLFTGGSRRVVDVWNAADGSIRFRLAGHRDSVKSLAVAPDSKTLATVSADGVIKLWHVATGQELFELRGADSKCHHVEFTRDGQHLLALVFAGEDHDILVFDAPRE